MKTVISFVILFFSTLALAAAPGPLVRVGLEASRGGVLDVARHTKVDDEVPPALELDNQIFAATSNGADLLAFELGGHQLRRLGSRKPRVDDHHALEGAAGEARLEPGTNRLDLRKLGHRNRLPVRR